MDRGAVSLVRTGVLLGAVLGLATGTFLVLDLLGLSGTTRSLVYMGLTTAIAAGIVVYVAVVVVGHARQPLRGGGRSGGEDGAGPGIDPGETSDGEGPGGDVGDPDHSGGPGGDVGDANHSGGPGSGAREADDPDGRRS